MPTVHKYPRAEADLIAIWRYIAEQSTRRADRLLDRLDETFSRLADLPYMGKARADLAPGLRMFPMQEYLIFYRPVEDGIEIVRVLHGSRHISRDLF
jgi:toxin ParE1/3/4